MNFIGGREWLVELFGWTFFLLGINFFKSNFLHIFKLNTFFSLVLRILDFLEIYFFKANFVPFHQRGQRHHSRPHLCPLKHPLSCRYPRTPSTPTRTDLLKQLFMRGISRTKFLGVPVSFTTLATSARLTSSIPSLDQPSG